MGRQIPLPSSVARGASPGDLIALGDRDLVSPRGLFYGFITVF